MKPSLIATLIAFFLSLFLLWLGTGHESAEAYLFPFLVALGMVVLSGLALLREFTGLNDTTIEAVPILRLLPILALFVAYVVSIEIFGMYSTSLVILFLIAFIYHPGEQLIPRVTSSALVSLGFIAVMYVLFSVLLKVQTPRGLFL